MASNYGIKVSKDGQDVLEELTELNKKNFQLVSTDSCLLKKEESASSSNTNRFLGYRLANSDTEAHPLNHWDGTANYIIYENTL